MGNKSSQLKKRTGKLKSYEIDPEERKDVITELIETERTYVEGLRTIVQTFQDPITQSKKMKPKHIKTVFGNIQTLFKLHSSFLSAIEDAATGTECREVGSILVDSADSFKEYTNYVNNCGDAQATLAKQQEKYPKLHSFIEEQRATLPRKESLSLLLMLPLQRIPRYVLLADDLLDTTPAKHPDHKPCTEALGKIKEVAEFVNNEKRIAENMQQLAEIEESIVGPANIVARSREFIQEGDLRVPQKNIKPLEVHYFLFNDLFVLVKKKSQSTLKLTTSAPRPWKLLERESLMTLTIVDEHSDNFGMRTNNGVIRFAFDSADDCEMWLTDFYEIRAKSPGFIPTPEVKTKKKKTKSKGSSSK